MGIKYRFNYDEACMMTGAFILLKINNKSCLPIVWRFKLPVIVILSFLFNYQFYCWKILRSDCNIYSDILS